MRWPSREEIVAVVVCVALGVIGAFFLFKFPYLLGPSRGFGPNWDCTMFLEGERVPQTTASQSG